MASRMAARCAAAAVAFLLAIPAVPGRGADEPGKRPVILVPPFENQSRHHQRVSYEVATGNDANRPKRSYSVDRYTEAPRSLLEDALGQLPGITIVERQRVDALLVEAQFGALSGLVDTENALRLGKLLGANLIVMGSVVDVRDETREFRGYGIATKNTEVICTLRVRLLEGEAGSVKFSKLVKGSKTYSASTYGGTASSDRHFAAIEAAVEQLQADPQFRAAVQGAKAGAAADGLVEVEFAPKPENCDVEVDGKYVGGSPLKRRLPGGKEVKVRIGKGGYKAWESAIVPEPGLRITRELEPSR